MSLSSLFDVFSRRKQKSHRYSENITQEFRTRVIQLCVDTFSTDQDFWPEIHRNMTYLYGQVIPTRGFPDSPGREVIDFLSGCEEEKFFDFVELLFKLERIVSARTRWREIVNNTNTFLQEDGLPYHLTGFVFSPQSDCPGVPGYVITSAGALQPAEVESYPQVIRRENTVLHNTSIEPTLRLLANPMFSSANSEFLEALGHYRKSEYADCLSKCGSSLESVMKIICHRKKWPYNQTGTAGPLLETIIRESGLEGFFKEPLMLVGTIRNRLSSAHGAGTQQRAVPKHKAAFALNATASAILLLVEETNP